MKFAMVSGLNESYSSHPQILKKFTDLCAFLQPLGYKGIELAILEPEKIPVKDLTEIAASYQMELPALGTGSTFLRFHFSLGDRYPRVRKKAIERLKVYIEFANESGSSVIIGLIRGRRTYKTTPEVEKRNIVMALKEACRIAENFNVQLLFEPINRFEIDSYNTIAECVDLLEEINSSNFKLLIDSFHTHLEEDPESIWTYLESITEHVAHLHLADDTRRAPGSGHFPFNRFLKPFKTNNFQGFASVETIMVPSFEAVARETRDYLRSIGVFK